MTNMEDYSKNLSHVACDTKYYMEHCHLKDSLEMNSLCQVLISNITVRTHNRKASLRVCSSDKKRPIHFLRVTKV